MKLVSPRRGPHRVGAGVGRIVEPGLRILHDVHRGDVRVFLDVGVKRHRQPGEVGLLADQLHFLDRPGLDRHQPARWLPQPPRERRQVLLRRHPERERLHPAVLDQDVAHAEAGILHDVLEQDRAFALGRQGADVIDAHRLANDGDRIAIDVEEPAQVLVGSRTGRVIVIEVVPAEHLIHVFLLFVARRSRARSVSAKAASPLPSDPPDRAGTPAVPGPRPRRPGPPRAGGRNPEPTPWHEMALSRGVIHVAGESYS